MAKEYCPNCGQPMDQIAKDRLPNGKWILVLSCPNKWACGTIVRKEE